MKQRLLALLAAAGLLLALAPAALAATETCVTFWENGGGGGDHWTACDSANNLKYPSVKGISTGLHNGCTGSWPAIQTDWNDCISSVDYTGLPANYKLQVWGNINYSWEIACFDGDGSYPGVWTAVDFISNDFASSWRVTGGNCP